MQETVYGVKYTFADGTTTVHNHGRDRSDAEYDIEQHSGSASIVKRELVFATITWQAVT